MTRFALATSVVVGTWLAVGCGESFQGAETDATADGAQGEAGARESGGSSGSSGGGSGTSSGSSSGTGSGSSGGDDGSMGDAPAGDDAPGDDGATDGGCACVAYWCGCGACDPAQIVCTVNPPPCTRGCVSSCPQLQQTTCTCDQGRCTRSGVDAGDAGPLACLQDVDCPPGDCCAHVGPIGPGGLGSCASAPNMCCGAGCP